MTPHSYFEMNNLDNFTDSMPSPSPPAFPSEDLCPSGREEDSPATMESTEDNLGRKKSTRKRPMTEKRAEQNRQAQRNFRQRKEAYIQSLEKQVEQLSQHKVTVSMLHEENQKLKSILNRLMGQQKQLHHSSISAAGSGGGVSNAPYQSVTLSSLPSFTTASDQTKSISDLLTAELAAEPFPVPNMSVTPTSPVTSPEFYLNAALALHAANNGFQSAQAHGPMPSSSALNWSRSLDTSQSLELSSASITPVHSFLPFQTDYSNGRRNVDSGLGKANTSHSAITASQIPDQILVDPNGNNRLAAGKPSTNFVTVSTASSDLVDQWLVDQTSLQNSTNLSVPNGSGILNGLQTPSDTASFASPLSGSPYGPIDETGSCEVEETVEDANNTTAPPSSSECKMKLKKAIGENISRIINQDQEQKPELRGLKTECTAISEQIMETLCDMLTKKVRCSEDSNPNPKVMAKKREILSKVITTVARETVLMQREMRLIASDLEPNSPIDVETSFMPDSERTAATSINDRDPQ